MKETVFRRHIITVTIEDGFESVHVPGSVHTFIITNSGELRLTVERRENSTVVREKIQGGIINPQETPIEAAKRELLEELGLIAGDWQELLIQKTTGTINDTRYYFIAQGITEVTNQTDNEVIATKDYPLETVYTKAMRGQFSPATQAAIARLWFLVSKNEVNLNHRIETSNLR